MFCIGRYGAGRIKPQLVSSTTKSGQICHPLIYNCNTKLDFIQFRQRSTVSQTTYPAILLVFLPGRLLD